VTLPPLTGGPSPPSGRPSCAWPASASASPKVRCLDHVDGSLADLGFSAQVDEVAGVTDEFGPDMVITFGLTADLLI
jgi:hypothetical protein